LPDFNFAKDEKTADGTGKLRTSPFFFEPGEQPCGDRTSASETAPAVSEAPAADSEPSLSKTGRFAQAPDKPVASEKPAAAPTPTKTAAPSSDGIRADTGVAPAALWDGIPPDEQQLGDFQVIPASELPASPRSGGVRALRWIASIGLALGVPAFLWFVKPIPSLNSTIESFLNADAGSGDAEDNADLPDDMVRNTSPDEDVPGSEDIPNELAAQEPLARDWDYFVQVSSQPRNPQAQKIANSLKRAGLPVVTEAEFIPRYTRAYYRVRVGPFAALRDAVAARDSLQAHWQGAFIDSARYDSALWTGRTSPILQPEIGGAAPRRNAPAVSPGNKPQRGFVVRTGSYQSSASAEAEKNRLLHSGFPAWIASPEGTDSPRHRVFVGPFSSRSEAESYARSLRASAAPDAYVVEIPARKE